MSNDRLPPQTKYIVGNEACERFSFYGVLALIDTYLQQRLNFDEAAADSIVHWWLSAVYFLPLLGAWIADRWWGRYRTIFLLSFGYCAGHALLSFGEGTRWGLFTGLVFLALGAGGIKPCVSAFVGDQFTGSQERLLPKVYGLFYWSINFGSFFAFAFLPGIRERFGYGWAFGLPGIAMAMALIIFWKGTPHYQRQPPSREEPEPPEVREENSRTLLRIAVVFAPLLVFWSLYDQQHTTWVNQARAMAPLDLGFVKLSSENMRLVNPVLVMVLIPLFSSVLYPWCERRGLRPTPLRRMGAGMLLAAAAFCIAALLQREVDAAALHGEKISIGWQFFQFVVITAGEVLLSTTGLEFAYSQAPKSLKSTILSLWFLAIALGDFLAGALKTINGRWFHFGRPAELLFYAGMMLVVAAVFAVVARNFRERPAQSEPISKA
jgi:POT family proton-dependent oligopeptide transporter